MDAAVPAHTCLRLLGAALAWRPAGLVETVGDRSNAVYRNVHIGDLIWIGNPDVDAHRRGGGTIHGILAESAMDR